MFRNNRIDTHHCIERKHSRYNFFCIESWLFFECVNVVFKPLISVQVAIMQQHLNQCQRVMDTFKGTCNLCKSFSINSVGMLWIQLSEFRPLISALIRTLANFTTCTILALEVESILISIQSQGFIKLWQWRLYYSGKANFQSLLFN